MAGAILNRAGVRRVFYSDGTPYKAIGNKEFDTPLASVYEDGGTTTYYVLPEVFKSEVCKGFDVQTFCEVLFKHDALITKEPGRFTVKTKLPGIGAARCYCIPDSILALDV